jgi:hypothetical protein
MERSMAATFQSIALFSIGAVTLQLLLLVKGDESKYCLEGKKFLCNTYQKWSKPKSVIISQTLTGTSNAVSTRIHTHYTLMTFLL